MIPVRVHPFFWILALLIGWLSTSNLVGTLIWAVIIFLSVLIHEYGHALTAHYFGQRTEIHLMGLGGLTRRVGGKLPWWKEFLIVLDGPLAGFSLALLAYFGAHWLGEKYDGTVHMYVLTVTFIVNVFWTVVNLLPIVPLDGGKLMQIILERFFGLKGTKMSLFISFALGGSLGIFFFLMGQFIAGALFLLFTVESFRAWKETLSITQVDQNDHLQKELLEAEQLIRTGDLEEAALKLQALREKTHSGVIYLTSTERLAELFVERGEFQKAYDLLSPLTKKLSTKAQKLLHNVMLQIGRPEEAIHLGNQIFRHHPDPAIAIRNAKCHALLNQERESVGWIRSAMREGFSDLQNTLQSPEFDRIRDGDLFSALNHKD